MDKKPYITASEIADFVYCPRGWWLRFNELLPLTSEEMVEGTAAHNKLAQKVVNTDRQIVVVMLLIVISFMALVAAVFYGLYIWLTHMNL